MCLMRTFSGYRLLHNCCWIWKSLPWTPTMFCFQLKPTNRHILVQKNKVVIWVFLRIGQFSEKSARGLSNMNPAQEDLDGKILMLCLGLLLNSKVLSASDFLKTRYFFLNHGILENVVPSIIRNQKKVKSLLTASSLAVSTPVPSPPSVFCC